MGTDDEQIGSQALWPLGTIVCLPDNYCSSGRRVHHRYMYLGWMFWKPRQENCHVLVKMGLQPAACWEHEEALINSYHTWDPELCGVHDKEQEESLW